MIAERKTTMSISPILFILILTALALASFTTMNSLGTVSYAASHGQAKHGDSATAVRNCLSDKGALQIWVNPTTGRRVQICEVAPQTFGLQILEEKDGTWQEVTTFIKSKMTRLDQVLQYLRNCGYEPMR